MFVNTLKIFYFYLFIYLFFLIQVNFAVFLFNTHKANLALEDRFMYSLPPLSAAALVLHLYTMLFFTLFI